MLTEFMRAGVRAAGFALLLACLVAPGPASAKKPIPRQFHGVWQPTTSGQAPSCRPEDADIRQRVRDHQIDFHEATCALETLEVLAPTHLKMRLHCHGEGERFVSRQEWELQKVKGEPYLIIRNLDPAHPHEGVYGRCSSPGTPQAAAGDREQATGRCYRTDRSVLEIRSRGDGAAQITIESAQANAHICMLSGTASVTPAGYVYRERLDGGAQCELQIAVDAHGAVTFKDVGAHCGRYYCGARASFDHIQFNAKARVPCP